MEFKLHILKHKGHEVDAPHLANGDFLKMTNLGVRRYFEEIERAKLGNEQSLLGLIETFDPILRKYAYLLSYEHCLRTR